MHPIIDYELSKTRHREITAEFDRYWRLHLDQPDKPSAPSPYRLVNRLFNFLAHPAIAPLIVLSVAWVVSAFNTMYS
jgi:hypothetical protein